MKKILPVGLIALLSISAFAVPAKKGVRTFTQADGSTISLTIVGDENFHSFVTTDGLAVVKGDDGNFYYRTSEGKSAVVAHNVDARGAVELEFIAANSAEMTVSKVAKAAKAAGTMRKAAKRGPKRESQVPVSDSPKIPVILVQYSDYSFMDSDPKTTFESFFNTGSVSALQYFKDQSNGKYTPQFEIYGPVTLTKKRSYYGGNDSDGYDKYVGTMVGEACNLIDSSIDFSKYDNNNDGECDVVIVMYAGDGEASSYFDDAENAIWPCQWELSGSDYGKSLTLDKTKVDKFAVFNELNGTSEKNKKIDGIGTFCHEYSHCIGLPDLYDTEYNDHFGMGPWSIMDSGTYNNDGYTPLGYNAYEKNYMGWIDIPEGTENTYYTLPVFNQKSADTDVAVKITNSKDKNEYYILENRAKQGWDKYMDAEGMLIYHVTYDATAWYNNVVNNYDMQRFTPIPADNSLKTYKYGEYYYYDEDDIPGDLWPYGNATELTDTSAPAAKVNTGSYMGKPVTEIVKNSDGTISFWFMKAALPAVATPVNPTHTVLSSTSAKIAWEPGDDADVTYTVEVAKHKDYELVNSVDFPNDTWTLTSSVNTDTSGNLYIGSSNKTGAVTSPVFTTNSDGTVTVIFSAKYYGSDGSSVKVSILDSAKNAQKSETVALTSSYATYAVVFDADPSSEAYIKFESLAKKKRVYLESAQVYNGDASDLASAARARATSSDTKTYTGITATSLEVTGLEENGTYDYRVKAVPVDSETNSDSAWTAKLQFSLSESNAVTDIAVDAAVPVYYNLQGIRIAGAPTAPGVYILRQGKTTSKVLIK